MSLLEIFNAQLQATKKLKFLSPCNLVFFIETTKAGKLCQYY